MCDFCDKMKDVLEGKERRVTRNLEAGERYECTAALHVDARKGKVFTAFIATYSPFKLNYCPECGANIKRRIRQWKKRDALFTGGANEQ
ncbi:MAG: hypothetical protein IKN04_08680 [Clostridia bacterium]|nr:hypothetical protein [Clostridia bacterium]